MIKLFTGFLLICGVSFVGCASKTVSDDIETQLQVRNIQTRTFDTHNTKLVMKSMIDVLQDEGFIVKNAVFELGLLSAEKNVDVENTGTAILLCVLQGASARWSKQQIIEASANVSEYGGQTRVRMNFQTKTMDNYGCPKEIITIKDPEHYQKFFEKVSKGIFIQEQNI